VSRAKNPAVFSESIGAKNPVEGDETMQMTLDRALAIADSYPRKRFVDELVEVRRATADAEDFITRSATGRFAPDIDDAAALCGYADLIRAGYPVKLAGTIIGRIRSAMRDNPDAWQLVTVTLENGSSFTRDIAKLDVFKTGYTSGSYITTALLFDARNYRARVMRSIEAYEPEVEDVAA